jgi:hypothetical protein
MPLIAALLVLIAVLALAVLLLPVSLIQRYRLGTRRRAARGWMITLNLTGVALSTALFLFSAAVMSPWIPGAFTYSVAGLTAGCLAGLLGLALTRWEPAPGGLHYTPSRPLLLGLTLVIFARLIYGIWRSWHAWTAAADTTSWLAASGAQGSLAAGAVVLGYYFVFWVGVRRRLTRAQRVRRI